MKSNHLDLVPISTYNIPYENYYYTHGKRYNTSQQELLDLFWITDGILINRHVAIALQQVNLQLQNHWAQLLVKDWYRSKEFYDFLDKKRGECYPEHKDKLLNTKKTYPHSNWNTVDVTLLDITWNLILMRDEELKKDPNLYVSSFATMYYEYDKSDLGKEIHKNRMLLKNTMNKYGFIWISNEYRHYEYNKLKT